MHPNVLFPNYEYSIYIDAVFQIELDIYRLMSRMGNKILGLFDHHQNVTCIYQEAETIKRIGKASTYEIDELMSKYKAEGFPKDFGFCECGLIIRKHNEKKCIDIMDLWWKIFLNGPKRDQLSFMYCVWKNNLQKSDIAYLGATYWDEPIFSSERHKK